jgi:hypothetical protein
MLKARSLGLLLSLSGMALLPAAVPPGTREVLAEFETGATKATHCAGDLVVGSRREVSRFQILPEVWREHSSTKNYQDPAAAWVVAEKILRAREATFRRATGREWDAVDVYLMWNAPGAYQKARWDRTKVSRAVRERAQRYANLWQSRAKQQVAQVSAER